MSCAGTRLSCTKNKLSRLVSNGIRTRYLRSFVSGGSNRVWFVPGHVVRERGGADGPDDKLQFDRRGNNKRGG